jgi:hypothetical protein
VLLFANGPGENYKYYGDTATTNSDLKGDALHGQTTTFTDPKLREIFFAAVFLPGKIKKAKKGQKEMIVVHEFIHSAGIERQRLARFSRNFGFFHFKGSINIGFQDGLHLNGFSKIGEPNLASRLRILPRFD